MESFLGDAEASPTRHFREISRKQLDRYVQEIEGERNVRDADSLAQMKALEEGLEGKRLMYRDVTADNGLLLGARS